MSAFLVTENTMQNACEGMLFAEHTDWYGKPTEYTAAAVTSLGRMLYALNNDALDHRYPQDIGERDELEFHFMGRRFEICDTQNLCRLDMVQRFKSLCCLLYQCNEGENDQTDLYKRAERASLILAARIVQASQLWETAKWGMH